MLLKITEKIVQENAFEQKKPGLSQIPSSPFSALLDELGTSHNGLLPAETPVTSLLEMASAKTKTAVAIFLIFIARCISEETCEKVDTCSCKFKNGSTVNLRPEDGGKGKPKLVLHGVIVF